MELALTPALGMTAAAAAAMIRALERMGAAKLAPGMAHTLLQGQRRKRKWGLFSSCSLHRPFCCDFNFNFYFSLNDNFFFLIYSLIPFPPRYSRACIDGSSFPIIIIIR